MPDYKQTIIAGEQWNRFSRIVIDNPRNIAPTVLCVEQEVIALENGEVVRDIGNLNFPFDPATQFDIIDPATNVPTGQKAYGGQVYALVYSYVMAEAAKRDLANAQAEADAIAATTAIAAAEAAAAAQLTPPP
ncbi:hypothetical protein [Massilia sp. TSP1-1-2]|uniref:hypothetical protein n=1 Tax=Massilia sp. TSP1-1-2 TaxID=2804649 RepID=UPI003CF29002